MIKAMIYCNSNGICQGFKIIGHAGFAKSGQDIICAAVSVLVVNTINSIEEFTKDKISVKEDLKKGLVELEFLSEVSTDSALLLNSMILGLEGIIKDNGKKYIDLTIKEV